MLLKTFGVATISRWSILSDNICVSRVFTKSHSCPKLYCIIPYKLCKSSTAQIKFWDVKVVMCDSLVPANVDLKSETIKLFVFGVTTKPKKNLVKTLKYFGFNKHQQNYSKILQYQHFPYNSFLCKTKFVEAALHRCCYKKVF